MSDEVDFLHADKNENFIQIDIMIFDAGMIFEGDGQAFPKFPKQQVCNGFTISQKWTETWSWFFACRWTS